MFFTIFLLCQYSANAATTKTCLEGLFCTQNGKYTYDKTDITTYERTPAVLFNTGWNSLDVSVCGSRSPGSAACLYYVEDYDETWNTWFGFYFVKDGEVLYYSTSEISGVFSCSGTYPSSDSGAKSVFQCYRTNSDGQKEYYKTPNKKQINYDGSYNTNDINTILTSLQSAIDQANTATQNLQAVLKKSNDKIAVINPIKKLGIDSEKLTNTTIDTTQALENKSITTAATPKTTNTKTNTTPPTVAEKSDTKSDTSDTTKKFDFSSFLSPFSDRATQKQIRQPIQPTRKNITQPHKTNTIRQTRILIKRQNLNTAKNVRTKTKVNDTQNNKKPRTSILKNY